TICNGSRWGGHANKGSVILCREGRDTQRRLELTIPHELMHHVFVKYKGVKRALVDNITHAHGGLCTRRIRTEHFLYEELFEGTFDSQHSYLRDEPDCGHQRKLIQTVDLYARTSDRIGGWIRDGVVVRWPAE